MRRFGKLLAFSLACSLALILTIQHRGRGLSVGANSHLKAAPRSEARQYDLSQLPIFLKASLQVRENYFDKNRLDHRKMLVGALDFVQRDVPEILIDRWPEKDPKQVTVKVNGQQKTFAIDRVEAPWSLTGKLKEIFQFIQPNLQPVPEREEARRLVEIEMAATNGMLFTLDPHSTLLDAESYRDMRTQTLGKFGGLGIVIEMDRKNRITVKRPMPDTPAWRAGIKAKDHIVRIDNESTMNMTLNEAVDRLRGDESTTVEVYVERDNVAGQKKFTIVRALIRPPSIDPPARVLSVPAGPGQAAAKVGYFRMANFTANSDRDLAEALQMFERERVRGIIMDLRFNPGGLLDQAQKVADAFIEAGTLVSTVGIGGSQREDKHATKSDREPKVPIAVLVNQSSASASEIVAGALKNLDRGVIIGESTFGKGSVQVLYDINSPVPFGDKSDDDKLGLKLTIAQYLTPGDVSIQGVGVIPDVEVVPMMVQKEEERSFIRLQASTHRKREADLEQRLENPTPGVKKGEPPLETVSYLFVPRPSDRKPLDLEDDEEGPVRPEDEPAAEDDSDFRSDFLIEMARDLVAQAKSNRRRDMVNSSKAFFERVRADEDRKLVQALEKMGVDWSSGPAGPPPQLEVSLAPVGEGKVAAGALARIRGRVRNIGTAAAYRVRALLESDNPLFDENEMVFGKIGPGESKTYDLTVKVPVSILTRTDVIKASVQAQRGVKAGSAEMTLNLEGMARPLFAYTYQTIDDVKGNKDGQVQRGEQVRTLVTVKNIGGGRALKTEAVLRNGPGQQGILISAGRFDAKELAAGETKTFSFVYEVRPEYRGDEFMLDLMVADTMLGEEVHDRLKVRVASPGAAPEATSGTVTIARDEGVLREAPVEGALVVGRAAKGSVFKVTGKLGAFTRVELENGRSAFLAAAEVVSGGTVKGSFRPEWHVSPPVIALTAPTVVSSESIRLKGAVTDDIEVRDVFVKVWNRSSKLPIKKVFYKPNRGSGNRKKLDFEADVPLWPGNNIIQVFARESNEVRSLQTLVVLRRSPPSVLAGPAIPPAGAPNPGGAYPVPTR